jgi:uncharacterized protein YecE (DUF72 family)
MPIRIGTSGWQYADWRGVLYPPRLPQRLWLEEYARHFDTLELNNSFYRLPSNDTFAAWRQRLPVGFVVAVKASRYLTHIRRLRDPAEPVARLMAAAGGLGDRLGPILLQLPPTQRAEPGRLAETLALFPDGSRIAVEPRHASWWTDETRQVLVDHGAALCWADRLGRPQTPLWRTTTWGYLRFHEGRARPRPSYGDRALRTWADRVLAEFGPTDDVFAYFNNDPGGAAIRDARRFTRICAARRHS